MKIINHNDRIENLIKNIRKSNKIDQTEKSRLISKLRMERDINTLTHNFEAKLAIR